MSQTRQPGKDPEKAAETPEHKADPAAETTPEAPVSDTPGTQAAESESAAHPATVDAEPEHDQDHDHDHEEGRPASFYVAAALALLIAGAAGFAAIQPWLARNLPASLADHIAPRTEDPRVASLSQEIADLRQALDAQPAPADGPSREEVQGLAQGLTDVTERLGVVEERVEAAPEAPAEVQLPQEVQDRLAALETTVAALQPGDSSGGGQTVAEALAPMTARIADLERELAAVRQGRAQAALEAEIDALRQRLAEVEAARGDAAAAKAVALARLSADVGEGRAYATSLEAFRGVWGDAGALPALEAYAGTGLPDLEALRRGFPQAARAAQRGAAVRDDAGMLDRIWGSARTLVTVRPAGDSEGTSVGAILSRAEAKLARGDLDGAVADLTALPPDAAAAEEMAAWRARAEGRLDALAELDALETRALADLAGTQPGAEGSAR